MTGHAKRGLRSVTIDFPARGLLGLILFLCLCVALGACGDDNDNKVSPTATATSPTGPTSTAPPMATATATPPGTTGPTATMTEAGVNTPTPTDTPAEMPTPEPTIDYVCEGFGRCTAGNMSVEPAKPCLGEADCDGAAGESCMARGTCTGGANPGAECAANGDCGTGGICSRTSRIELQSALITLPLGLVGSVSFHCGEPGSDGNRDCSCTINEFAPIQISGIGFLCISPGDIQCDTGFLDCDGGSPADLSVVADGNIGTCTDGTDCTAQCDAYCSASETRAIFAGCTGYCTGGERDNMPCDCDTIPAPGCPADGLDCPGGQCNGPDPATAGTCQCQCIDAPIGEPSGPGAMTCNLPTNLVVEEQAPCGDGDVMINVGSSCLPLTTATASSVILNANSGTTAFPAACMGGSNAGNSCRSPAECPDGSCEPAPTVVTGAPEDCASLMTGHATSQQMRGVANFFGSALGDLVSVTITKCE
jgi:hypothetical protein